MNYQTKKYISIGFLVAGVGVAASGIVEIIQGIEEKDIATVCEGITSCAYGLAAAISGEVLRRGCNEKIQSQKEKEAEQARLQGQYHMFQQDLWKSKRPKQNI